MRLYMVRVWNVDTASSLDDDQFDERHLASGVDQAQRQIDRLQPDTDEMLIVVVVPIGEDG